MEAFKIAMFGMYMWRAEGYLVLEKMIGRQEIPQMPPDGKVMLGFRQLNVTTASPSPTQPCLPRMADEHKEL